MISNLQTFIELGIIEEFISFVNGSPLGNLEIGIAELNRYIYDYDHFITIHKSETFLKKCNFNLLDQNKLRILHYFNND